MERVIIDCRRVGGDYKGGKPRTVLEGVLAEYRLGGEGFGKCYACKHFTVLERALQYVSAADIYRPQSRGYVIRRRACSRLCRGGRSRGVACAEDIAEHVRVVVRGLRSVVAYERQIHSHKLVTAAEHEVCYRVRSVGQGHVRQRRAGLESISVDCKGNGVAVGFFEGQLRHRRARRERVIAYRGDRFGYRNFQKGRTASERVRAYVGERFGKSDVSELVARIERAEQHVAARQGQGSERRRYIVIGEAARREVLFRNV